MRIEIMTTSSSGGGAGLVGTVGDFLTDGLPDVGTAVDVVAVELLLRNHPRAPRDDGDTAPALVAALIAEIGGIGPDDPEWDRPHDERRAKGPRLTFRRTARRVDVVIVSELSDRDSLGRELHPEAYARAAHEVVAALAPLERRLRRDDDLDLPRLHAHLTARLAELPTTLADLTALVTEYHRREHARWAAMTDWERLDIDWTPYDAGARALLDDPFFWDPADDFAPHGSDEGADLLADYLAERPADGLAFLARQVATYGDDPEAAATLAVATAFAELKVTGRLGAGLRERALAALSEQPGSDERLDAALRAAPAAAAGD